MDSFTKFTQSVSTGWTPFADKVGRGFTQYRQMASEALGSGGEVTGLPGDYVQLEKRFDAVRQATATLAKLAKAYAGPATPFDMQALQTQFSSLTSRISGGRQAEGRADQQQQQRPDEPATVQHELARAALDVSERVGLEEPLGAALFKFGSIEDKVGALKAAQDRAVQARFVAPMAAILETGVALAQNARKDVAAARLTLDAAKAAFKGARADRADAARRDVEAAEDRFITAIEEAMRLMKATVESPEPLACLSEFVAAQLAFHKEAAALLGDLAPEIAEIHVTQEALYRHDAK
ncbi:BAR domain-containing protein [Coemansia javaensis]|uniref:BAR domain-containing protein n=1 Tax=Coemansia javaensis TaxID=2761396 RepID=A0A9W8H1U9_9FUNG|nr:BAR domain-containing protein [Coemansia javaensis]